MAVMRRVKGEGNFVVVPQQALNEPNLSWEAKGLLSHLLQHAEGWEVIVPVLIKNYKGGRDRVYRIINELIEFGYVTRSQPNLEKGKFGQNIYDVHRVPVKNTLNIISLENNSLTPLPGNPYTDNPHTEKPYTENTDLTNNKNNYDQKKTKKKKEAASSFIDKKLSEDQLAIVKQKTEGMFEKLTTEFSLEEWVVGVTEELINVNSFKKTNQEFKHKLNIILKMANNGSWCPRARLECKANEDFTKLESSRNELRYLIRVKQGEIASFKRYIPHLTGDHKQKNEIAIKKAEKELKDLMLTLHEVKEAA